MKVRFVRLPVARTWLSFKGQPRLVCCAGLAVGDFTQPAARKWHRIVAREATVGNDKPATRFLSVALDI